MGRQALAVGTHGEIDVTRQKRDADGRWKALPTKKGTAERWRARCYYRGNDGVMGELSRVARTRAEAEAALRAALDERLSTGHVEMTAGMRFVDAGHLWLGQIARKDSRLSERTVTDYSRTFGRYVDVKGSKLRGLTLAQANNTQRLRTFLQAVADGHGTGAAKMTRSVLMGVLNLALDNGTIPSNALRQVRPVEAQTAKPSRRKSGTSPDHDRALTREQRDALVSYAYSLADASQPMAPQTLRKRRATADLLAFMAGTGVRIEEARAVRWEQVNLDKGTADVHGTKSKTSRRRLTLPPWLCERLRERAALVRSEGYLFASPHLLDGSRKWDQSNSAKALAAVLDGAGYGWAVPHTLRRTVATLLHEAGVPLAQIADQLGHADPSMTARTYLGRDPFGDREAVAQHL
jgi:integrase